MDAWKQDYQWLLAWFLMILILTLINKTRIGHVFIYYWLWTLIFFLFVTQYGFIKTTLENLGQALPGTSKQGG